MGIVYLGFNDPRIYKRGVENVIYFQSRSKCLEDKYYVFFGICNEVFRWNDITCIVIKDDFFKYIKLNLLIAKLIKRVDLLLHSHNFVMTCLLLFNTDILTVHDAIYYQRKNNKEWKYKIFYLIEKFAYLKSNHCHFISRYTYSNSLLSKKKFEEKGQIIYNSSNFELQFWKETTIEIDREKYNIFTVRGIQKRTRIDLLINFAEFTKKLKFNNKKIHIYVAGKGELLDFYKSEISKRNLNNITLLGYISDNQVAQYYKETELTILPCEYAEGFGLPIIESYYFNKAVIASNRCAVPEILISSVFLFENTPDSIWETLNRVKKISLNYHDFYMDKFSINRICGQYEILYTKIMNEKNK